MYIGRVSKTKTLHLGDNNYDKLEVDVFLTSGESADQAEEIANKFLTEKLVLRNPHFFKDMTPDIPIYTKIGENKVQAPSQKINIIEEPIEEQMKSCSSPAVLKAVYEKIVKGKPELETIYNQKLNELSK